MKNHKKSKNLTFRSFTGLLLILNSLIMPQLTTAIPQPEDAVPAQNIAKISIEAPATAKLAVQNKQTQNKQAGLNRVIFITVTAYSSTPDQTDDTPFITANDTRVRDGIIAANFLRFGAKVKFPDYSGDKIYEVTDRMNERYPNRADIWMETREQALEFGIRKLKMEILPITFAEK